MSATIIAFLVIGSIIFIGYLAEVLFRKTKIPDILLLIAMGVILARFYPLAGSGLEPFIPVFTTFALIFILFEGAIRLDIKHLLGHLPKSLLLTLMSFALTAGAVLGISYFLGYSITTGLFLGFILGGISSSIVIPLVRFLKLSEDVEAALTLESALSDVLCIISTVVLIEFVLLPVIDAGGIVNNFVSIIIVSLVFGSVAGILWAYVLRKYTPANSYILTIALLIMLFAITEFARFNGSMAALAFGIILGNARVGTTMLRPKGREEESREEHHIFSRQVLTSTARVFYAQISFFVKTFFFVYIGMAIDFSSPISFFYGSVLVVGMFLVRPIAVWISHVTKNRREAAFMESMIPKGTAAAVLASLPLQVIAQRESAGFITSETALALTEQLHVLPNIVTAAIAVSIVVTAFAVYLVSADRFRGIYRWGPIETTLEAATDTPPAQERVDE